MKITFKEILRLAGLGAAGLVAGIISESCIKTTLTEGGDKLISAIKELKNSGNTEEESSEEKAE